MKIKLLILLILICALAKPALAIEFREVAPQAHYDSGLWYQEELYIDRMFGKLLFGAWNFFLGPFELIKEPYESALVGDNLIIGLGRGLYYAVANTLGGFANAVTFPITPLRIPLPEGGVDHNRF
ncbi:MAG: hypothetical protein COV74_08700 [Candidatus Omnitrophica bacterium CG11_big_fil_rev_8_21_14_0_20_45_26]|uniref:Exosortase system-associated protein, TIGR04073 family n=1 Tax=Candidatus Abzuiibacterium crystallinum TaxID=1974748 RepID=A0A2H0LMC2_9BACT|nr:MAG: hypothetical protein COV74_08700 [Candidatus Omnitrophica bacterium CG11_big_fil_rev_8_21_14_0_20_45_26]PIW63739.1 MAG: hypothetical protein COW12_09585 [Candidatus Omnitrophica bacterium CG12_big_fil_rev_8_21_14_0_65_45_16]